MESVSRHFLNFIVALFLAAPPSACSADTDLEEVRRVLKQSWDSLATLSYRLEEYELNERGERDRTKSTIQTDWCLGEGNRIAVSQRTISPDGTVSSSSSVRLDGRRRYKIRPFPGHPDSISDVTISAQKETRDSHAEMMNSLAWLMTPGGRPLTAHLDSGGFLEIEDSGARQRVVLVSRAREQPLRRVLDPKHDWIPLRVELGTGDKMLRSARRFVQEQGHWFPTEGTYLSPTVNGPLGSSPIFYSLRGFTVSAIRVNAPLEESLFKIPPLPRGTGVQDEVKGTSFYIGGTLAARKQLEDRYAAHDSVAVSDQVNVPLRASTQPAPDHWPAITGGLSAAVLCTAAALACHRYLNR